MALDIGEAFREGYERTVALPGLAVAALLFVLMLVNAVVTQSLTVRAVEAFRARFAGRGPPDARRSMEEAIAMVQQETPLAVDLTLGEAAAAVLLVAVLAETVYIVAVRLFASDDPDRLAGGATRRLGRATLHGVVAGAVTWLLVGVGLLFLIVPGVFLAVSLFFVRQEVALDDRGFAGALSGSWALTEGDRIEVFGLALVLVVLVSLAGFVGELFGVVSPLAGDVVSAAVRAVVVAFSVAVATSAYRQLRAERDGRRDAATPGATPAAPGGDTTGARDPDDPAA